MMQLDNDSPIFAFQIRMQIADWSVATPITNTNTSQLKLESEAENLPLADSTTTTTTLMLMLIVHLPRTHSYRHDAGDARMHIPDPRTPILMFMPIYNYNLPCSHSPTVQQPQPQPQRLEYLHQLIQVGA